MMTNLYLLSITAGTLLLTLVGLYVGWRSFRVFMLRLELLSIRNRLWDSAREKNCFENESYQSLRSNLNLMIRHAHRIDVITLALTPKGEGSEQQTTAGAGCPELQSEIEIAIKETATCMCRYVVWHRPFSGIFLFWAVGCLTRFFRALKFLRSMPSEVARSSVSKVREFSRHPEDCLLYTSPSPRD